MRGLGSALVVLLTMTVPSYADDDTPHRTINVHNHGAKCNGVHDDTAAFRAAIQQAPVGGAVLVPPGRCVITDTLLIKNTNAVSILGAGRASQIFQRSTNKTLFEFQGVNALFVRDLYLGSAATASGTALIKLTNSHHMRIDNITMLGSYYGLHLNGSLLNTVIDLRSGTNFQGFFAVTSPNQYWVFAERFNGISANANTFIAPVLEGGMNGIYIRDIDPVACPGCIRNGEGSLQITGGTIEGVSQTALNFDRTFLPSSVVGTHLECNGTDVVINDASNIRLSAVFVRGGPLVPACSNGYGLNGVLIGGTTSGLYTRNIQISDSIIQGIIIDVGVKRVQLQNITTDLNCTSSNNAVLAPFITPPTPSDSSNLYVNIAHNCT